MVIFFEICSRYIIRSVDTAATLLACASYTTTAEFCRQEEMIHRLSNGAYSELLNFQGSLFNVEIILKFLMTWGKLLFQNAHMFQVIFAS